MNKIVKLTFNNLYAILNYRDMLLKNRDIEEGIGMEPINQNQLRDFEFKVREAWGNPRKVAEVAFGQLFPNTATKFGLDHDDPVAYAVEIGILLGEMKDKTANEFLTSFVMQILFVRQTLNDE